MSTTTFAPPPQLNGAGVVPAEAIRETDFLEKLLWIRDEVFASKHPRIHLPSKVLEQVVPRPTQQLTPPVTTRPATNGTPNGNTSPQLFLPHLESSLQQYQVPNEYNSPVHVPRAFAKSTSSGIDPILLTKSDHLIRAELQLKRQQIERALKDNFDKKGRGNDASVDDRDTYFDVESVLAQAQAQVKPLSGLPAIANNSDGSESFDENSYYSSKANSWSSDERDSNQAAATVDAQLTAAKLPAHAAPASKQADPMVIDLDEEPYEPADDIEIYEPEPARIPEEQEESDYSPPPADIGPAEPNRGRQRNRPTDRNGGVNGSSRRQSPTGNPPPIRNSKKRRREEKRGEKRQQQIANKRVIRSPDPVIKEEPVSPPPFATYSDSQPSKRRALQPLPGDVEMVSGRDGRMQPVYYHEQDHSPRSYRQYEEPLSPTVVRVPQRRLERDDQDLRRVASLQYARRPYSPGGLESYPVAEPRQMRAASHAFVDRPMEPVYREASVRASVAPRYIREPSRSPIHEYLAEAQAPIMMAPPPRRIVVDMYGNKYYAAPVEARESMAPPSRRVEAEPYYERAATLQPTMRAPVRQELYEVEEEGARMMPPPPARRYVEASVAEPVEGRSYRQRESSRRPVDIEYARPPIERRPVVQYEDMGPPREYMPSRAYSVRPEVIRREAPDEYAPARHGSVAPRYMSVAAPRYREVSVVQHGEPLDERRYGPATPQRRYVEDGATGQPLEVAEDPFGGEARRVSYRY